MPDPISSGLSIASTITSIVRADQQAKFQDNMALLSDEEKVQLAKELAATNDRNTQLQILSNAISQTKSQQVANVARLETTKLIVLSLSAVMVLGLIIYYYK